MTEPQDIQTDVENDEAEIGLSTAYKQQHAKVLRFELAIGKEDDDRTIEEFEQDIRDAVDLMKGTPRNVTLLGGYYIIDGKVCMATDYDHDTKNRKPGTHPPVWAGGPSERELRSPSYVADEDDRQREFVRVTPSRTSERNPHTGRRVRSDKGVKKGPKKSVTPDKLNAIVADLGEQMMEATP